MIRHQIFTAPQSDHLRAITDTGIAWITALSQDEKLVMGFPQTLGTWDECDGFVAWRNNQESFLTWLYYYKGVLGTRFACLVVKRSTDLSQYDPGADAPNEIRKMLSSLAVALEVRKLDPDYY